MKTNTSSRLKQIMAERGLKQVDILNKSLPFQKSLDIKMGKSTLSQYVNGVQSPDQNRICLLSKTLNVNEAWLMGFDVPKNITEDSDNDKENQDSSNVYNYFDVGLSAGVLTEVNPFTTNEVKKMSLSDSVMGKYAGDKDVIISRINGESMNRSIPDGSMIAIKQVDSIYDLKNGDIVVFQDAGSMSVKKFYKNDLKRTVIFSPDSNDNRFFPMSYSYDDLENVRIIGKVVVYIVEI